MAYVPQNVNVYACAFSGALAGMGIPGKIFDPVQADYANLAVVAGTFAQQFDTVWAGIAPNVFDGQVISEACAQYWQNTSPAPQTLPVYTTPTTYNQACTAIIAMIKAADAFATGQGITFPAFGGGGTGLTINTFTATTPADSSPHTLGPTIAMPAAPSAVGVWGMFTVRDTTIAANAQSGIYLKSFANIAGTATITQVESNLPAGPTVLANLIAGGGNLIAFSLTGTGNICNWLVSYIVQPVQ